MATFLVGTGGYATINLALAAAKTAPDGPHIVEVSPGTYTENVVIDFSVSLVSTGGPGATTINNFDGTTNATVLVAAGTNNVTIQGFTINGFDGASAAIETSAVYVLGAADNFRLLDNVIVANGEAALLSNWNVAITNAVIQGNTFSGQTFEVDTLVPGDIDTQFIVDGVARQLIAFGQGYPGNLANNITFTGNTISGDSGLGTVGNNLVTIDANNSTISDNVFTGYAPEDRYVLRGRGSNVDITDNDIVNPTALSIYVPNNPTGDVSGNTFGGTSANDVVTGTVGDDLFIATAGSDTYNGLGGFDTVDYSAFTDDLTISTANVNKDGSGTDAISGIEKVIGGSGNDTAINASSQSFTFQGGAGDDYFQGSTSPGAVDTFVFGAGVTATNGMAVRPTTGLARIELETSEGFDTLRNVDQISFADGKTFQVFNNNAVAYGVNDTGTVEQTGTLEVDAANGVLKNDIDLDGSVAGLVVTNPGTQTIDGKGTLTLAADGSYSFVADPATANLALGASTTAEFTYSVSDGSGQYTSATLTITITGTNDNPDFGYTQNINNNADGIVGDLTVVSSFLNSAGQTVSATDASPFAIVSKAGGSGPFTTFDGYREGFVDGLTAEVKVYLDTGWETGEGFDYSVAATRQSGTHLRDFIFHIVKTADGLFVGADNNGVTTTNLNPNPTGKTLVSESGWYTLQHVFGQTSGPNPALSVTMNLLDADGEIVFTMTRTNPADLIATVAGGNRYAWFNRMEVVDGLAVDDISLAGVDSGEGSDDAAAGSTVTLSGQLLFNDMDGDSILAGTPVAVSPVGGGVGYLGTLTAVVSEDPTGSSGGTITWNFEGDVDSLGLNDSVVQVYELTVSDGNGGTATKTVSVTLNGANDVPVFNEDFVWPTTLTEDEHGTPLMGDIAALISQVVSDPDGDAVSLELTFTYPVGSFLSPWTATIDEAGNAVYEVPASHKDYNGPVSVLIKATDENGGVATKTIEVEVTGINDNPHFDFNQGFETDRGGVFDSTTPGWSAYGSLEVVTEFNGVTAANGSSFAVLKEPNPLAGDVRGPFSQLGGYRDKFVDGMTAQTNVYLDTSWTEGEGFSYSVALNDDSGTHLQDYVFSVVQTADGLKIGNGTGVNHTGAITLSDQVETIEDSGWYTLQHTFKNVGGFLVVSFLATDASGNVAFTYDYETGHAINDVGGNRYAWYAHITAEDGIAVDDISLTGVDSGEGSDDAGNGSSVSLTGQLLFDDVDGDAIPEGTPLGVTPHDGGVDYIGTMTAEVSEDPTGASGGTITWSFEANVDHLGTGETIVQEYDLTISDGKGGSATKTVTVTIVGTNDAPIATAAVIDEEEGAGTVTGQLVATDADAVHTLTYALDTPVNGFSVSSTGAYTLDLSHSDFVGLSFGETVVVNASYTVTDDQGATSTASISITVTGTNEDPVVGAVTVNATEGGGTYYLNALENASDADGDNLIVVTPTSAPPAGVSFIGSNLTIDFEDYQTGAITNQGWTDGSPNSPDQAIVDVGGNKMLHLANETQSSDFAGPYSPTVSVSAGESTVADVNQIEYSFKFKAVSETVDGSRLEIDMGNAQGTDRNNFMVLEYFEDSLRLVQGSPVLTGDPDAPIFWDYQTLAENIDPTEFHTIRAVVRFEDGPNNDVIDYYFNDVLVGTGSTFENYGDAVNGDHSGIYAVNRMLFRAGNVAITDFPSDGPGGARQGFYIDDINIATSNSNGPHFAFDANDPAYDHLAEGITKDVTFSYEVSDGVTTTTQTATFTVTGTNDAPVAVDSDFEVDEDAALETGSVTANDVDDGAILTYSLTSTAPAGLTFNPNGTYSFDPSNAAYQSLGDGVEMEIVVQYKVVDQHDAEDTGTLTITVVGTNDAPVVLVTSTLSGEVTEPVGMVAPPQASGTVQTTDDGGAVTYSAPTTTSNYGTFSVHPDTGVWTFTLGDGPAVQALGNGDEAEATFAVVVTDSQGLETSTQVVITINGTNEVVEGTANDDVGFNALQGTAYADTITAGAGDDTVYGGSGNDIILGQLGDDIIYAGSGNDTVDGGGGDDYIDGGSGNDTLRGGSGSDFILGGSGHDIIEGGQGSDTLSGGSGDDILWGGSGRDVMTGGDGADTFKFVNAEDSVRGGARDVITDFEKSESDKIDLREYDANINEAGINSFFFRGNVDTSMKEDAGYLKYFHKNGDTWIVGGTDDNPDGLSDLLIILKGERQLEASDFLGLNTTHPDTGTTADDVFFAGTNQNTFTGNGGADRFVFTDWTQSRYGNNWDVITDWNPDYVIDLSGMNTVDAYTSVSEGAANRVVSTGQIKWFEQAGSTFIVGDTTGDGLADFKIEITEVDLDLTALDFLY